MIYIAGVLWGVATIFSLMLLVWLTAKLTSRMGIEWDNVFWVSVLTFMFTAIGIVPFSMYLENMDLNRTASSIEETMQCEVTDIFKYDYDNHGAIIFWEKDGQEYLTLVRDELEHYIRQ